MAASRDPEVSAIEEGIKRYNIELDDKAKNPANKVPLFVYKSHVQGLLVALEQNIDKKSADFDRLMEAITQLIKKCESLEKQKTPAPTFTVAPTVPKEKDTDKKEVKADKPKRIVTTPEENINLYCHFMSVTMTTLNTKLGEYLKGMEIEKKEAPEQKTPKDISEYKSSKTVPRVIKFRQELETSIAKLNASSGLSTQERVAEFDRISKIIHAAEKEIGIQRQLFGATFKKKKLSAKDMLGKTEKYFKTYDTLMAKFKQELASTPTP